MKCGQPPSSSAKILPGRLYGKGIIGIYKERYSNTLHTYIYLYSIKVMYKDLSEEDLILLAMEFTVKGVPIPSGIVSLLSEDVIQLIEDNA
jgi:hypothetical protein